VPEVLARAWREAGLRGVWFGALAWARLYRRLELVELSLEPPPAVRETPLALEYGFLSEADDEDARARLERGDRCFVAWDNGTIVSSRWIGEGRVFVDYLNGWIDLEPGEVFLSETFTVPAMRGRGVSGAAGTRLGHALADEGCRRILAGVLKENHAGKRAYEKAGYRPIGRIGYVKLGPWRRDFRRRSEAGAAS
jgi:RimJ/RimL family protein N-acetyltransferase